MKKGKSQSEVEFILDEGKLECEASAQQREFLAQNVQFYQSYVADLQVVLGEVEPLALVAAEADWTVAVRFEQGVGDETTNAMGMLIEDADVSVDALYKELSRTEPSRLTA